MLAARALAPVALGELLEGALAPALADRVASDVSAGGGAGASSPAALEALGTLEALLTATPPALLLEKSAPALTRTFEVLDRIGQQGLGANMPACLPARAVDHTTARSR